MIDKIRIACAPDNGKKLIGTMERKAYRVGLIGNSKAGDVVTAVHPFKDVWHFQSNRPV